MEKYKNLAIGLDIEKLRLPLNSYRQTPLNYGKFFPFVVGQEGGLLEHNQLNWTNKFLLEHLAGKTLEEITIFDQVNHMQQYDPKRLSELIQTLTTGNKKIESLLQSIVDKESLEKAKNQLRPNSLSNQLEELGKKISVLEKTVNNLAKQLGIASITGDEKPVVSPSINMIYLESKIFTQYEENLAKEKRLAEVKGSTKLDEISKTLGEDLRILQNLIKNDRLLRLLENSNEI